MATLASLLHYLEGEGEVCGSHLGHPESSLRGLSFAADPEKYAHRKGWGVVCGGGWQGSDFKNLEPPLLLLVSAEASFLSELPSTYSYIAVRHLKRSWSLSMSLLYAHPQRSLQGLAVTGTNGKTSTVWSLHQILHEKQIPHLALGTFGARLSLGGEVVVPGEDVGEEELVPRSHTTQDPDVFFPLLDWAQTKGARWWVMEMSSHSLVQEKLYGLSFDGVIWTSFSQDHLDYHKTMLEYFTAKKRLFLPPYTEKNTKKFLSEEVLDFSVEDAPALVLEKTLKWGYEPTTRSLQVVDVASGEVLYEGKSPYFGAVMQRNLVMALWVVQRMFGGGDPTLDIEFLPAVPGRMNHYDGTPEVVIDYAHSSKALQGALQDLRETYPGRLLYCVFGCGGERDRSKRALMGEVAFKGADGVWVTSDNPRSESFQQISEDILQGTDTKGKLLGLKEDRREAIEEALECAKEKGAVVLVAGKGCEEVQHLKGKVVPYSDKEVILGWKAQQLNTLS